MPLQKLTTTDSFVYRDIADAPAAGVVRTGRKILQSSAKDMARSVSYTFGLFGINASGASAGINYEGDELDAQIAAFVDELGPVRADGSLDLIAGKGVDPALVTDLSSTTDDERAAATAATLLATIAVVRDGAIDQTRIAIDGNPGDVITTALTEAGVELVTVDGADKKPWLIWGADADIVLAGSKIGALTHDGAPLVKAQTVIGWGPAAVTTKAFAMLSARGTEVVPAFLAASGGYLLQHQAANDLEAAVDDAFTRARAGGDTTFIGACTVAEAFIASWTDTTLFGRPLA